MHAIIYLVLLRKFYKSLKFDYCINQINIMASMLMVPKLPLLVLKNHRLSSHFHTKTASYRVIRNEKTSSFNYRTTVNVPLNELPGVYQSFHPYYLHLPIQKPMFLTMIFVIFFVGFF